MVVRWCAVFLVVALFIPMLRAPVERAQAADGARLYLETKPLQDEKVLVVDVQVADVVDLYSAAVQLHYDPSRLEVQDAVAHLEGVQNAPGTMFPTEGRFVITNQVDIQTGNIDFAVTLVNPAPPVSGSGTLVTVVFKIVGSGPTQVEITRAELVSSDYAQIPATAENLALDGDLQPLTTGRGMPIWGWWVTGMAGVSLAAIVGVSLLRRTRAVPPPMTESAPRKIPTTNLTSSRSSVALTEQAQRALDRGDISLAYELFSRAVEQDPANAQAWLGKGLVAQHVTEKRICFQRVLALDPANVTAQSELQQLSR